MHICIHCTCVPPRVYNPPTVTHDLEVPVQYVIRRASTGVIHTPYLHTTAGRSTRSTSLSTVSGRIVFRSNGTTPDSIHYRCSHTRRHLFSLQSNWKITVFGRDVALGFLMYQRCIERYYERTPKDFFVQLDKFS